jgi:hypothetical protein
MPSRVEKWHRARFSWLQNRPSPQSSSISLQSATLEGGVASSFVNKDVGTTRRLVIARPLYRQSQRSSQHLSFRLPFCFPLSCTSLSGPPPQNVHTCCCALSVTDLQSRPPAVTYNLCTQGVSKHRCPQALDRSGLL